MNFSWWPIIQRTSSLSSLEDNIYAGCFFFAKAIFVSDTHKYLQLRFSCNFRDEISYFFTQMYSHIIDLALFSKVSSKAFFNGQHCLSLVVHFKKGS